MDTSAQIETAKAQRFYADTQGLSDLKLDKDNPDSLKAVAKEFEALFIKMILKSMRDANKALKSDYFDSNDESFYEEMYDSQMAEVLAGSGKLGLSQAIVNQMSPTKANIQRTELKTSAISNTHSNSTLKHKDNLEKNERKKIALSPAQEFIRQIWPHMVQGAKELGVDPKVLAAQAILETGWGEHINKTARGGSSYNLFNIKAQQDWQGQRTQVHTTEFIDGEKVQEKAQFRAYTNLAESVKDYVNLIKGNPRYQGALQHAENPKAYIHSIHCAGYATDPQYRDKIMRIYSGEMLNEGLEHVKKQHWSLKI